MSELTKQPFIISDEAKKLVQLLDAHASGYVLNRRSDWSIPWAFEQAQLAINQATEKLTKENEELKAAKEKVLSTAASFEYWGQEKKILTTRLKELEAKLSYYKNQPHNLPKEDYD